MTLAPILLVGGSGIIGRWTGKCLRAVSADIPLLIGGRDLAKAQEAAAQIRNAEGVALDLTAHDLGLDDRAVSAVAVFFKDHAVATLRFAQERRVPHIGISSGLHEIGPEVASYMHKPEAAPVVLGAEWLVGATTVPTLELAREFAHLQRISVGALLDEHDVGGPAQTVDLERLTKSMPAALLRRNGSYLWQVGDDARSRFRAVDGTEMEATAFSPYDVVGLATATGAPDVDFNLAIGVSSTRRRGEPISTEIVIDLAGKGHSGRPLRTRHAVVHPHGQMPLTGLGVAMSLERLVGLDGEPPTRPGLYFPYQLLDPARYFARLSQAGGIVLKLEVP